MPEIITQMPEFSQVDKTLRPPDVTITDHNLATTSLTYKLGHYEAMVFARALMGFPPENITEADTRNSFARIFATGEATYEITKSQVAW